MKILTAWLRDYLPSIPVTDRELADDLTLRGIAVDGLHPLGPENGHLLEMDVTTNRVDAMNHYGIAREAATIYNLPIAPLEVDLPAAQASPKKFPVRIESPDLCGRFTARVLREVTVGVSVGNVKRYFEFLGQKQISTVVDASNFTLLGMGHPTHAFDLDKIEGGIIVRLARKGEKLKLLDGTDRLLESDDLVIADEAKALSLAGVMGGFDSMITPATKNILVESAWFSPASIRRSARRHLLHTDASHRFERGADFNAAPIANHLVTRLILQNGGWIEGRLVDIVDPGTAQRTALRSPIHLSLREVQRHLGTTLDDTPARSAITSSLVQQYLTGLGCSLQHQDLAESRPLVERNAPELITNGEAETFQVTVPSWRLDLDREIDLIEEIARVYGYNRFANTIPAPQPVRTHVNGPATQAVRRRLLALGFSEAISSTFSSDLDSRVFSPISADQHATTPVLIANPLSEEASNLRPSLLPGMLGMLAHNLNRDVLTVRLFEQGEVFADMGQNGTAVVATATDVKEADSEGRIDEVYEQPSVALGITSSDVERTSLYPAADAPFFELKGVIEYLASLFSLPGGANALTFTNRSTPAWLQSGRSASVLVSGQYLAHFGELALAETTRRKLRQPVFIAEIYVAVLYAHPLRNVTVREISRYQAAERDFSFVFPDSTRWHSIAAALNALSLPDLKRLVPIETFRDPKGKSIPAGQHSILLRTIFQSNSRTLTDDEITTLSSRIIAALIKLGGTHRA